MSNVLGPNKHITRKQGDNLKRAAIFAGHYGMPLTVKVDLHWALAGMDGNYRQSRKALFKRCGKWFYNRGLPWACVWVTESGVKQSHIHFAYHCPDHLRNEFADYIREIVGGDDSQVLRFTSIYDLPGCMAYLLKGCKPSDRKYFGIPRKWHHTQGVVWGKRCGCSEAIDEKARAARLSNPNLNSPVETQGTTESIAA
jgi:hypothetical protein